MKCDSKLSLCIQIVLCTVAICAIILAFAHFDPPATVKEKFGNGAGNSKDGKQPSGSLPGGSEKADADESNLNFSKYFPDIDFNSIFGVSSSSLSAPTATPKPGGSRPSSQIKYAQTSYNMAPIIQMNLSWKRASKTEPITFDAGSTYDPDGYIVAYEWSFGDGSMASGKTVDHAYKDVGKYSVKLRVVDNNGAERSAFVTAIISNKPPVAVPGNDTSATVGETVWFNGTGSYDPDGRIVSYEWSFGDGASAKGESVTHVYARPDKYKAELKVTDDSGANSTAYRAVTVTGVSATPAQTKAGSPLGIVLLAGAGIACIAVIFLTRKKGK